VKHAVRTFLTWLVHAAAIDILSIKKEANVFFDEPLGQGKAANVAKVVCPVRLAGHAHVKNKRH